MPVTLDWYDPEHKALIQTLDGEWTWDALRESTALLQQYADSVQGDLLLLIDMSRSTTIPKGNTIANGQHLIRQFPTTLNHIIVIFNPGPIKTFLTLIFGMIPAWRSRIHFVKRVDEGHQLAARLMAQNRMVRPR